jgi:cytochrome c oxidase subunit 3
MRNNQNSTAVLLAGKTGLFLLMITVIILFGTLTFAFAITARPQVVLPIPGLFFFNTLLLLFSSLALHFALSTEELARKRNYQRIALWIGGSFLFSQAYAWISMLAEGLTLNSNGQELAYLYLLSGLHALHLLGGLLFLGVVHQKSQKQAHSYEEMATYFWHFLGLLWVFLLIILSMHA